MTGAEKYSPAPDIEVYNPHGPNVAFSRTFNSAIAEEGHNSRGLWLGWMHNWDVSIYRDKDGDYTLVYPNGASESIAFNADGTPWHGDGRPYVASVVRGATRETDIITLEASNRLKRIFQFQPGSYQKDPLDPANADGCRFYTLQEMRNGEGHSIFLTWSVGIDVKDPKDSTNSEAVNRNNPAKSVQDAFKLDKIEDDSSPRLPLLTLTYKYHDDGHDRLDHITDVNGRVVTYGSVAAVDSVKGTGAYPVYVQTTVLGWVSPPLGAVVTQGSQSTQRWTYDFYTPRMFDWQSPSYTGVYKPYLWKQTFLLTRIRTVNQLATPSSTECINETQIHYDQQTGRVDNTDGFSVTSQDRLQTKAQDGRNYVYDFPAANNVVDTFPCPVSIPVCHPGIQGTLVVPNINIGSTGAVWCPENLTNRVVKIDPSSHKITGTYEAGRETYAEYDDPLNPFRSTQVTDENGRVTTYEYDDYGNQTQVTSDCEPAGTITSTVRYSYDFYGQTGYPHYGDPLYPVHMFPQLDWVETTIGGKTPTTVFMDATTGKVTQVKSPVPGYPSGTGPRQSTILTYTPLGNLSQVEVPGPGEGLRVTSTLHYGTGSAERYGEPVSIEDPMGRRTYFTYTIPSTGHQIPYGTVESVKDDANYGREFTYDLAFNIKTATGLHLPSTVPTTRTFKYAYPNGAPLVSIADSRLSETRTVNLRYDGEGRLDGVYGDTQPVFLSREAGSMPYDYPDPLHRVTRRYDEMVMSRPSLGLPDSYQSSPYTGYTYSRSETATDYTLTNTITYPMFDRQIFTETHPKSCTTPVFSTQITEQSYDATGASLKDGSGGDIRTRYLFGGRAGELTDVRFEAKVSANQWTRYTDPFGWVIDVHYTYDQYGRIVTATKGGVAGVDPRVTVTSYAYDDLDDVMSVTTSYPVVAPYIGRPTHQIAYEYYPDGSRKTMTVPTALQADGTYATGQFHYAYNSAGQMTSLTNPFDESTSWSYDPTNGWLTQVSQPNATTTGYAYDSRGFLQSLVNAKNGTVLSSFTGMQYDLAGNLTDVTSLDSMADPEQYTGTTHYTYDSKNQLKTQQWTYSSSTNLNTYYFNNSDAGDNLRAINDALNPLYNTDNQRAADTSTTKYDADGNPTLYKTDPLVFDAMGKLSRAQNDSYTASYGSNGLREWKTENYGPRTYFVYDGAVPVLEMNFVGDVIATNTFGATGLLSRRATYFNFLALQDEVESHVFQFDPSGNVINARWGMEPYIGPATNATWIDPYRGPRSQDVFGFAGQSGAYSDSDIGNGLVVMGYRYYDMNTGRFLTRDPIGYAGGPNLYAYCGNNPVNHLDPLGLDWIDDFLYGGTNFFNGFTNKIGFGWITHPVQDWLGVSGEIDHCSSAYNAGQIGGTVYNVVNTAVNVYSFVKSIPNILRAAGDIPESLNAFKSFTRRNFRYNLAELTDGAVDGAHAHHVFPLKFRAFYPEGLNINDPHFGAWWEAGDHLHNATAYNAAFEEFLTTNPTAEQLIAFGREIAQGHGLNIHF